MWKAAATMAGMSANSVVVHQFRTDILHALLTAERVVATLLAADHAPRSADLLRRRKDETNERERRGRSRASFGSSFCLLGELGMTNAGAPEKASAAQWTAGRRGDGTRDGVNVHV